MCGNGEILNYRDLRRRFDYPYRTDGDTETILACYAARGAAAWRNWRVSSPSACTMHGDSSLWLARDRVGILPLYYYVDASLLAFASEIKASLEPSVPPGWTPKAPTAT